MPDRPYPSIWDRLRGLIAANPTPPGEQRLIGAVQHAQAEQESKSCDRPGCGWCVANHWCSDWQGRLP